VGVSWIYEPDEKPKRKHAWDRDDAGFETVAGDVLVGKCPKNLTLGEAQELLEGGIPWSPRTWRRDYPQRIYAVRQGAVYRATPTVPGLSYHGFPEHPSHFPQGERELRQALLDRAKQLGCEVEVGRWLRR
jgi:hypothetical protein